MNKSNSVNVYHPSRGTSAQGTRNARTAFELGTTRWNAHSTTFAHSYRIWSYAHAGVLLVLVGLGEVAAVRSLSLLLLASWNVAALVVLFSLGWRRHPDGTGPVLPNALTGTRVAVAIGLFAFISAVTYDPAIGEVLATPLGWLLPAVLLLVELTDFFDGRIARKLKAGGFGAIWDMESDVVYALALAVLHRHVFGLPIIVLAIGLMRPLYVLLWRRPSEPAHVPRTYKMFAKTTAATLTTGMIVATAPVFGTPARIVLISIVLAMQIVSFGWDLVLQRSA